MVSRDLTNDTVLVTVVPLPIRLSFLLLFSYSRGYQEAYISIFNGKTRHRKSEKERVHDWDKIHHISDFFLIKIKAVSPLYPPRHRPEKTAKKGEELIIPKIWVGKE